MLWHEWVGLAGIVLMLLAFLFLQLRWFMGNNLIYQVMNTVGSACVLIALLFGDFNFPVFIAAMVAWLVISLFGIAFAMRRRRGRAGAGEDAARSYEHDD